ncbi:hypothetical protein [Dysosmobacter sp. HCP28S3_G4]|uniref:hypothetical protein n=1 Tax=Dysosmobacter sp. HCP28S3_G4 TaxID=3438938 RepID=UPI003F8A3D43
MVEALDGVGRIDQTANLLGIDDILRGGVDINNEGKFVISGEKAARLLRDTIRLHLDAAVETIINKNAAPTEEPKR